MTASAFAVRDVALRLGGAVILEDVSLDVSYGRVLALVGPNGAGKSSLLSLLCRDAGPTAGSIRLDGRPLQEWRARDLSRARSVLMQSHRVAFSFTAAQVIEMGRAPWVGTEQSDADAECIADAVALTDVAHLQGRSFPSLSGGEQARVSLARVLAQNTAVVLLDEPTAALDIRHQEDVLRIARDLAGRGRAIVVVLHDLSLAAAYADDVVMLDGGRIVAAGEPRHVLTEERIGAVYGTPVRVIDDPDTGRPVVLPRRSA